MPYEDFFGEVERTRYDIELLSNLFEMTYETVAHRVCNLGDPKRPGHPVPLPPLRRRRQHLQALLGDGAALPRGVGSCAKWAVHIAFLNPSVLTRQYSMMPDGTTYFCFAQGAMQPLQGSLVRGTTYSIGLGTHAENAQHLAYAQDMPSTDRARSRCRSASAAASASAPTATSARRRATSSRFNVDEYTKKDNFFSPLVGADRSE